MLQRLLSQLVLPVVIVGIGAGGLVWLSAKNTPPQRVTRQPTPQLVETVALQSDVPHFQIQVNGNVVPSREVTLSAQVDGVVTFKGDSILFLVPTIFSIYARWIPPPTPDDRGS